jgi:hypothetical protein
MATPRKNWFKVADSVAFEDWPNDVAATFLRLGAYLNTRWARDGRLAVDRGRTTVSSKILQQLTGSGSLARARRVLNELAAHVTLVIDEQGTSTVIEWRKYADFQGTESGTGDADETVDPSAVPSPSPISEPSPNQAKKEEKRAPSAPPAPRSCLCPDELSDHDLGLAMTWADGKGFSPTQLAYGWERVRAWSHGKGMKRIDWLAVLQNAMTDGWALKGYGQNPTGEPESPAQARARRTKESARRVFENFNNDPITLAIEAQRKLPQ